MPGSSLWRGGKSPNAKITVALSWLNFWQEVRTTSLNHILETVLELGFIQMYKMTCAPSSVHPHTPIKVFAVHSMGSQGHKLYFMWRAKTGKTMQLHRLIWVFSGHTSYFVRFPLSWLNSSLSWKVINTNLSMFWGPYFLVDIFHW